MEAKIAYFSAEFGIDSSLPIYSGGLGVLAGDHVKAANDLGIPLVGVGIFYKKGYFQQQIGSNGNQEAVYPTLDPKQLSLEPVLNEQQWPLLIQVPVARRLVYLQAWKVQVGDVPVYLLDADHERNRSADRHWTDHLYGGNQDTRIVQEIIIGIGGVRLLHALGIAPDVWHMNEGHSAFLGLERIRQYSEEGISFHTALEAIKASTVFTTHTPVPAGHDQFSFEMMDHYLGDYYWQLGTCRETILSLGKHEGCFNMTRLAMSTSCKVNGVSKMHAEVTKELLHRWMPDIPQQHIPVDSITNGVHTLTWLAPEMKEVYDRYLEEGWTSKIAEVKIWDRILEIPNDELWQAHQQAKRKMIQELHLPLAEDMLIIGFARRFATYKRALLLFQDMKRLEKLLLQANRPIAFLFAGKAHPADLPGQLLIKRIQEISQLPTFKNRIILLENYDMKMAKFLISGVDVWLNTPVKPMEASGTSGQKAAVNGVINCSILDGWWCEGYNGKNGWAIKGDRCANQIEQDVADSQSLYHLLESQIMKLYYEDQPGWTRMMKESIRTLTPVFSTSCMVAEYWVKLYIPTAIRGRRFVENGLEVAERVASYKQFIRSHWHEVKVERIELIPTHSEVLSIHARIQLGSIWHRDVLVEAVGSNGDKRLWKRELQMVKELEQGVYLFAGTFAGSLEEWKLAHANLRVLPISPDFAHDYELELATWG